MTRGDVIVVRLPHASGSRGKKRPVVVVQSDAYQGSLKTVIVAGITSNLGMANDPACFMIDSTTPEGQATGVARDSVVSCLILVTVYASEVDQTLGRLSPAMLSRLDGCLRAALGLP